MDQLPPSVLASGSDVVEHDLVHQAVTQRGDAVNVSVVFVRRSGIHTAKETLHIEGHFGDPNRPYLFAAIDAEQCCPRAPQDDVRHALFKPGTYVVDGDRTVRTSHDLTCEPAATLGAVGLRSGSEPTTTGDEATVIRPLLDRFVEGFIDILGGLTEGDATQKSSLACIQEDWTMDTPESRQCMLSTWENWARRNESALTVWTQSSESGKRGMRHATARKGVLTVAAGCLLRYQSVLGWVRVKEGPAKWSRAIARAIKLLTKLREEFGHAVQLVLMALCVKNYRLSILSRAKENDLDNLLENLASSIQRLLKYISYRLRNSKVLSEDVFLLNPVALCHRYSILCGDDESYSALCANLDVSGWESLGHEVCSIISLGELLTPTEDETIVGLLTDNVEQKLNDVLRMAHSGRKSGSKRDRSSERIEPSKRRRPSSIDTTQSSHNDDSSPVPVQTAAVHLESSALPGSSPAEMESQLDSRDRSAHCATQHPESPDAPSTRDGGDNGNGIVASTSVSAPCTSFLDFANGAPAPSTLPHHPTVHMYPDGGYESIVRDHLPALSYAHISNGIDVPSSVDNAQDARETFSTLSMPKPSHLACTDSSTAPGDVLNDSSSGAQGPSAVHNLNHTLQPNPEGNQPTPDYSPFNDIDINNICQDGWQGLSLDGIALDFL